MQSWNFVLLYSPSDLEADLEDNQDYDSAVSQSDASFPFSDQSTSMDSGRSPKSFPWSNQSKFSSYSSTNFKSVASPVESKGSGSVPSYQKPAPVRKTSFENDSQKNFYSSQQKSPNSPKSPRSSNQVSSISREPMRPVSSVTSRYQQSSQEEPTGYQSRFNRGVRGPVGQQYVASLMNKENKEDDASRRKLERV